MAEGAAQWWSLRSMRAGWHGLQGPSHLESETGVTPGSIYCLKVLKATKQIVAHVVSFSPPALFWVARPEHLKAGEEEQELFVSLSVSSLRMEVLLSSGLSSIFGACPLDRDRSVLTPSAWAGTPAGGVWSGCSQRSDECSGYWSSSAPFSTFTQMYWLHKHSTKLLNWQMMVTLMSVFDCENSITVVLLTISMMCVINICFMV